MSATSFVYAIGDIHGCLHKLQTLMARCERHAGNAPAAFVFLGDYIDRGPDSAGVIRTLMHLQTQLQHTFITLKGNHEAAVLDVIDGTSSPDIWLREGGAETLQSYGVERAADLPTEHVAWLRSLPLHYDDGRRFFAHAGIDPDRALDAQHERDLIWIREPFLSDTRDHGRLVVHGHTPVRSGEPDLRSNRLNVDTGAVYGRALTAAIFRSTETNPIGFLQAT